MTENSEESFFEPRADKPQFLTDRRFAEFELHPLLLQGLEEAGFIHCTPIQAQTLPVSLSAKDVAGQAQTGTGKTAAFLITVFSRLLENPPKPGDLPSALIVAPTRELALQIHEEALRIGKYLSFSIHAVIGGIDYQKQADILRQGADIVICTPGRIIDYYKQGIFKPNNIRIVVIDEADRLLDLGFAQDMRFILRKLPRYDKRQSMLFSATLAYRVLELTYEFMNVPEFIAVAPEKTTVEGIEQVLYHVGMDQKLSLLLGILQNETWNRVLIFVNTKTGVEWVSRKLKGNGFPAEGISGDLPQRKRLKLMEDFKEGKTTILVATDVASRGIHVEDITHVINYDLPQDPENYVHRIGRTARAGKTGKALSLACETYVFHLEAIEALLGGKIPVAWPPTEWYVEDRAGHIAIERERRTGKPDRKPSKTRPAKPAEKPRQPVSTFRFTIPRGENYFPGSFFGFGPQPLRSAVSAFDAEEVSFEEDSETVGTPAMEETETVTADASMAPAAETSAAEITDVPKPHAKKRRRRRKKKTSTPPPEEAAADVPADPSKDMPEDDVPF
ncbi:MAG: DEAD/DEAH box helicase [Thermodesulfobacteriota bacterium]